MTPDIGEALDNNKRLGVVAEIHRFKYSLLNDLFVPLSSGPMTCTKCRPVDRLPLAVAVVVYSGTAKCLAVNNTS